MKNALKIIKFSMTVILSLGLSVNSGIVFAQAQLSKETTELEEETTSTVGAQADEVIDAEEAMANAGIEPESIRADQIDQENAIRIEFAEGTIEGSKNGKKLNSGKLKKEGIVLEDSLLTLEEGVFILSGVFDGQIQVKAGKKSETVLILDGICLQTNQGAAISCEKTASLVILLKENTENTIICGDEIEINEECINLTSETTGGAIYSKADTVITGKGSLKVYGYINNGIHVTKTLTIDSGNIDITAVKNGIKAKDSYIGEGGNISISSGNDGIQAKEEGIQAQEEIINEESGEIEQEAQEAIEATGTVTIHGGRYTIASYNDGIEAQLDITIDGGYLSIGATGTYNSKGSYSRTHNKTFSAKGLKSAGTLTINGGTTVVKSYSDALNSDELMTVNDGILSLYCGDDGLHSETEIVINGGTINISNSYEGIEAKTINVNDGSITIFAWDDGMNASSAGFGGFGSRGGTSGNRELPNLNINGGDVYINANGDGVDSNGNLTVTGGRLVVDGPTDSMNGALDSGTESGGTLTISGGLAFAGGASGMAECFNSKSEQNSFIALLNGGGYKQGSQIKVTDPDGNVLFEHTAASAGTSIVFSCPELQIDETYLLTIDDVDYEVTLTGTSTRVTLKKITAETTAAER